MRRFEDHSMTRRKILQIGGGMAGYSFMPLPQARAKAAERIAPRASARFCIFVMLEGGQSQVDSWDFKEGPWTPPDFDVQTLPGVGKWPLGLYPKLAERRGKYTLLRSMEARESLHGRAQYSMQTGHRHNPALAPELPSLGSVVAHEYASQRRGTDFLPPFVGFNTLPQAGLPGSGLLPASCLPFHVNTASDLTPPALEMPSDQRCADIFAIQADEQKRYGDNLTADAFILARNLVTADAGTHFIFLTHGGWDHHGKIYERQNFYRRSRELDTALSQLLDDLNAAKRADGASVLDETLIVCVGEFGRTPGELTAISGRGHYPRAFTAFFAGGGVNPGQVLGGTDERGAKIVDPGWSGGRGVSPENLAATIYSALGIDWTKKIAGASSGRTYSYIEPPAAAQLPAHRVVEELFA